MRSVLLLSGVAAALALPLFLVGCDREVSHTSKTSVSSDGTVKSTEKVVTETADGGIKKEETVKKEMTP